MMHAKKFSSVALAVGLVALSTAAIGCHTPSQCPYLQTLTGYNIPAPLPREGDTYKVIGYRTGIRFYVVQYTDKLYRGGDILSREGAEALKALGIKTVIAVTPSDRERALAKEFGFQYVEIPFGWFGLKKAHLDQFLAALDKNPAPVYVHCKTGDLCAGILLAHYRVHRESWSVEKALQEYYRLDANTWDSVDLAKVLKENATKDVAVK